MTNAGWDLAAPSPLVHSGEYAAALRFVEGPGVAPVLLIRGATGAGKSVLLSRVASAVRERSGLVEGLTGFAADRGAEVEATRVLLIDDVDRLSVDEQVDARAAVAAAVASGSPIRVIATSTHDNALTRIASEIELPPLPQGIAARFLRDQMGDVPATLVERIARLSGGNPALLAQAVRDSTSGFFRTTALNLAGVRRLPARYQHLGSDFTALPIDAQAVLAALAVHSRPEVDEDLVEAVQEQAVEIERFARAVGRSEVEFSSPVHRAAVLLHAPQEQIRAAHRRAASSPALSTTARVLHASLAADGPTRIALMDEASALLDSSGRPGSVLVQMAAAETAVGEDRAQRWASVASAAVFAGDLTLASYALHEGDTAAGRYPDGRIALAAIYGLRHGEADAARRLLATAAADARTPSPRGALVALLLEALERFPHRLAASPGPERSVEEDEVDRVLGGERFPGDDPLVAQRLDRVTHSALANVIALLTTASHLIAEGSWAAAITTAQTALERAASGRMRVLELTAAGYIALCEVHLGRLEEGDARARAVLDDVSTARLPLFRAAAWQAQLHRALTLRLDAPAAALPWTMDPHAALRWSPFPSGLVLDSARSSRIDGDRRPLEAPARVGEFAAAFAHATRSTESARLLTELVERPVGHPTAYELARARLELGEDLLRDGERSRATPHLVRAAEAFDLLGAVAWRDRAASAARDAGRMPVPDIGAARRDLGISLPLTEQEARVVALAASGMSNKAIGQRLYLSPRTVAGHLYNAFPKLGITTRAALRDALTRRDALRPADALAG